MSSGSYAGLMKLVDAPNSEAGPASSAGSTPAARTSFTFWRNHDQPDQLSLLIAISEQEPIKLMSASSASAQLQSCKRQVMEAIHHAQTPTSIVGSALFLASDEAGLIAGQTIAVDGGLTRR